jgi:hypothetical protein
MFDDPKALTNANWNDIHIWLQLFWTYVPLIVTFAITMLVAHALIPSLIMTGQLPQTAHRFRIPLTGFAFLVLIAAVTILVLGIDQTLEVDNFWDRYLI